jgi:primary-amine oxidase
MVVPYGSADPMHSWKAVHDGTEYGFGALASSLTLGCDCLGEIHYFDGQVLSYDGSVGTIENAICLHEEDYGVQWKHSHTIGEGFSEVRRSRRLVISSFSAVGNYDYGIFWYLYLDGTIELEMKLTGIVGVSTFNEKTHNPTQTIPVSFISSSIVPSKYKYQKIP